MQNETKTVYAYDTDDKFTQVLTLDHTDRSQASGAWQIPAQCTEVEPPAGKEGFDRVFKNGAWEYTEQVKEDEPETPQEPTFVELQSAKLSEIDLWTKQHITGGFLSTAKGTANFYDSADADQLTFAAMYAASKSPDFATTPPYNGQIPIRAVTSETGEKEILQHNATEMQKLIDDLALHIGTCKQIGWQMQEQAKTAKTKEELEEIVWA